MHIAILTDGITPYVTGGMQRHSFHLVKNLLAMGEKITLVHTVSKNSPMPSQEEVKSLFETHDENLEVVGIAFPENRPTPGHYIRESYAFSCQVFEALKERWVKFDFIYAKGFTAWCLLEHKKKGFHTAPVGVKFHGYEMYQKAPNIKLRLTQFLLRPPVVYNSRNANAVFSYGGEITEIIKKIGVDSNKIIEIGSGVDDSWVVSHPKPQQGTRKFLFMGRRERRKGIEELLHCADLFEETQTEMHWIGPIFQDGNSLGKNHVVHGEIKDSEKLKALIDECQVLIAPSHSEGMPNVILEAMARGLAVISTSVGAIPQMISNQNGRLIVPRKVSELKRTIREIALLPEEELMKMRVESLKVINQKFTWSRIAEQTLHAIREVTFSSKNEVDKNVNTD